MRKLTVFALVLLLLTAVSVYAKKPVTTLCKISGKITIDGSSADFKKLGIKPVIIDTQKQVAIGKPYWLGKEKQSAKVYVAFDDEAVYLCAIVKSPKHRANKYKGGDIYKGNSIELFLGFDNSDPEREMYTETDYQVGLSTGWYSSKTKKLKNKPTAFIYTTEESITGQVKIKVKTTKTGYILEAKIPSDVFEGWDIEDGNEIGFDIGVDDVGDSGLLRKIQLTWSGDKNGWQNPKGWGIAKIKEK